MHIHDPKGTYSITPRAGEAFPHPFENPKVELVPTGRQKAQHPAFAPLLRPAMLAQTTIRAKALADAGLRERVVQHNTEFYYSKWVLYDVALPGCFRLVPSPERLAELRRDYGAMAVMLFGAPPPIDELIETLLRLETEINGTNQ